MADIEKLKHVLRFGAFEANLHSGELRKHDVKVRLQEQPFRILTLLLLRPGEVVTRDEIRRELWGDDTFVDFERGLNKAVNRLREALGDSAENPQYIETLPKRGYRFIAPVDVVGVERHAPPPQAEGVAPPLKPRSKSLSRFGFLIGAAVLVIAAIVTSLDVGRSRSAELDTVVLADFDNRTDESVFDETLKRALSISLEQSPFLKILSDQQVSDTLRLMMRNPHEPLTPDLARSVCRRTGNKAVVAGSIAALGSEFVIGVDAIDCETGERLAQEQARASQREEVLSGIDDAANRLRRKLGESLPSIEKYSKPTHEALSTPSLEAFQAYANAERMVLREGSPSAIPFFKRAVEIDPDFGYAHAALGLVYGVWREASLASEHSMKAYALQDRVTEWEKFFIAVQYHFRVTRDIEKALEVAHVWSRIYPRERTARNRLAAAYALLGKHEKAAAEIEQARVMGGDNPIDVTDVARVYTSLGRLTEAKSILQEAIHRSPQRLPFRQRMYQVGFLLDDHQLLQEELDWANGESGLLAQLGHYDTEAYFGRLAKARQLFKIAVDVALRTDFRERAAWLLASEALLEAEFGNPALAGERAQRALAGNPGPDVQVLSALALAQTDSSRAREIAEQLDQGYPSAPLIQNYWLPAIRAEIEIALKNPSNAIELLRDAEPYELSSESAMIPVYVRGKAHLSARQGQAAVTEFQKLLEHRGIIGNSPIGALAQLGLARALTVSGNISDARMHYQRLLAIWKDADPNLPVLKDARSEFARIASAQQR